MNHAIVSREEWIAARKALLLKEASLSAILPDLVYLGIFGAVALAIATPLFRRTL